MLFWGIKILASLLLMFAWGMSFKNSDDKLYFTNAFTYTLLLTAIWVKI